MIVLNVGGGSDRVIPDLYKGWTQEVLDVDINTNPDILGDSRSLNLLHKQYDSVYCAHNLEHVYHHEVQEVLSGFLHVLNPDGFAYIIVPDIKELMWSMLINEQDIHDVRYRTDNGTPISYHDVLYGWNEAVKRHKHYMAHRCGFTEKSLNDALIEAGFKAIFTMLDNYNIHVCAFKQEPTIEQLKLIGVV